MSYGSDDEIAALRVERDSLWNKLGDTQAERDSLRDQRKQDKARIEELSGWYNAAERSIAEQKALVVSLRDQRDQALNRAAKLGQLNPDQLSEGDKALIALSAELEQAKERWSFWKDVAGHAEQERVQAVENGEGHADRAIIAETRVEALSEALREIAGREPWNGVDRVSWMRARARAALAAARPGEEEN